MSLANQTIPNHVHVSGTLSAGNMIISDNAVKDDAIAAGSEIDAEKVQHRPPIHYQQDPSGAVAAATVDIYYYRPTVAGTVNGITAAINGTLPTGDGTITVDLKKSTAGGAFASILSSVITLDSGNTLRIGETGTVSTPALATGDWLQLVVAQGKTTGNQGKGLSVNVSVTEAGV